MIKDTVQTEVVKALKEKNEVRLSTMRMLLSALNYERINKMHDLSETEELDVVRKEAKKRTDAIEMYTKVGETARAASEQAELVILQEFLPQAMSTEELTLLIDESIAQAGPSFGAIMKVVLEKANGRADGKQVSEILRAKLQ